MLKEVNLDYGLGLQDSLFQLKTLAKIELMEKLRVLKFCLRFGLVLLGGLSQSYAVEYGEFSEKRVSETQRELRYELYFSPQKNDIELAKQKIDYDLSHKRILKLGPYVLKEKDIEVYLSREEGEFYDLEFGLEVNRRIGSIYVISFRWPSDFIDIGKLEIIDDKGQSYWQRQVTLEDLKSWQDVVEKEKQKLRVRQERITPKNIPSRKLLKKADIKITDGSRNLGILQPRALSRKHWTSNFGLAHKGFFEVPISSIKSTFRYCLTKDDKEGRVAICSRRYRFVRVNGRYRLKRESQDVKPRVLVNDKPVTLKGTAIFLDNKNKIKMASLLGDGTYYEFVSRPKKIKLIDMVKMKDGSVELIGYGDPPMGQVEKSFYANMQHWGLLNFMPTIGDMRKFWRARISKNNPFLYLKGYGGAPFRQDFIFKDLPSEDLRVSLLPTTQKSTYSDEALLTGMKSPGLDVFSHDRSVRAGAEKFTWKFKSPKKGVYNVDSLLVREGKKVWKASYEIYRGYPREISARLTGVVSDTLSLVLLGEVASQFWFESLLGWQNYYASKLRWGVALKHFSTIASVGGEESNSSSQYKLAVSSGDLKYRLTPGIWGRDPSVGLLLSTQQVQFMDFTKTAMLGGGVFWARSMPKVFDDLFNILPIFRYPKWVDMEFIYYFAPLDPGFSLKLNTALNFHGKVQWSENFFGEGGFGIKLFSYQDLNALKSISTAIAYGTVGVGYNW